MWILTRVNDVVAWCMVLRSFSRSSCCCYCWGCFISGVRLCVFLVCVHTCIYVCVCVRFSLSASISVWEWAYFHEEQCTETNARLLFDQPPSHAGDHARFWPMSCLLVDTLTKGTMKPKPPRRRVVSTPRAPSTPEAPPLPLLPRCVVCSFVGGRGALTTHLQE